MQPDINWEFWLDNLISPIIAKWMNEKTGFTFYSSYTLKLSGVDDLDIYQMATQKGNVILISKDSDFPQIIAKYGSPQVNLFKNP